MAEHQASECEERITALLLLLADLDQQRAPGTASAVKAELERLVGSLNEARARLHGLRS